MTRTSLRFAAVTISAIALSSCVTPPAQYAVTDAAAIQASKDQTWQRLVRFFSERSVQITNMDKPTGFLSASWQTGVTACDAQLNCGTVPRDYLDCGRVIGHLPVGYKYKVNVVLNEDGTGTRAKINTDFVLAYRIADFGGGGERPCVSTGILESEILAALRAG